MRQVVLDTETTGLDVKEGHRIIEVACIELNDRKPTGTVFHEYVNPERAVDQEALKVHGIDNDFLAAKPMFADVAQKLFDFLNGAQLIIHNAAFDLEFLNYEFGRVPAEFPPLESVCEIEDTLEIARESRPGRRNSLDALANQFEVDLVSERSLHGALLDARILVEVYRAMTGGQTSFEFEESSPYVAGDSADRVQAKRTEPVEVFVLKATEEELSLHESWLDDLDKSSEKGSVWRKIQEGATA